MADLSSLIVSRRTLDMLDGNHQDEIKELLDRHRKNDMMDDLLMWGGMYGFGSYRSRTKNTKNKKSKKKKPQNWFEKLTVDQLKQLCRASNSLQVSGTKSQLVQRLLESDITNHYSHPPSKKFLEDECREKGLKVSGNVYDLVLRLIQHKTGKNGATGDSKKRVRDDNDADDDYDTGKKDSSTVAKKKPRAKIMKLPNEDKLTERAYKKANPLPHVTNKWGTWKYKDHSKNCVNDAIEMIKKEVFGKDLLFQRSGAEASVAKEELAWKIIYGQLRWIFIGDYKSDRPRDYYKERQGELGFRFDPRPHGQGYMYDTVRNDLLPVLITAIQSTTPYHRPRIVNTHCGTLLRKIEREYCRGNDRWFSPTPTTILFTNLVNDECQIPDNKKATTTKQDKDNKAKTTSTGTGNTGTGTWTFTTYVKKSQKLMELQKAEEEDNDEEK